MVDSMFESGVKRSAGAVVGKGRAKGKMAEDGESDEDGDGLAVSGQVEAKFPQGDNISSVLL